MLDDNKNASLTNYDTNAIEKGGNIKGLGGARFLAIVLHKY